MIRSKTRYIFLKKNGQNLNRILHIIRCWPTRFLKTNKNGKNHMAEAEVGQKIKGTRRKTPVEYNGRRGNPFI